MKVRVTLDIDDTDRMIIGLAVHGRHVQATREELVDTVVGAYEKSMLPARAAWKKRNDAIVAEITAALGGETTEA